MGLQPPEEDNTSSLLAGVGQATEQDIHAVLPHPLEDNSAMDGFAVNAKRLANASPIRRSSFQSWVGFWPEKRLHRPVRPRKTAAGRS